jgi:uncharacterized glyoxalase superfamily protein PhnB/uncharacterized protein YndB with AHSA1/START domain
MINTEHGDLIIKRKIDAPKKLVFETFTQVEHLKHWWGPAGMDLEVISLDLQPGGKFHYKMIGPNGMEMYGVFNYREVNPYDQIVFTSGFSDEKGNLIPAPFDANFPMEILNTWNLEELNGQTLLTLHGKPLAKTSEERTFFFAMHDSMNQGFGATFDQLDRYLSEKFKLYSINKSNMARTTTYVNFPGTTEEAFLFYKSVFRTEFVAPGIQRFGDIPADPNNPPMSDALKNLVLHIELPITGGHILMGTDAPKEMGFTVVQGNNMHISLEPDSRDEAKRIFEELSVDGKITMALQDMFWGAYFGSFTDKYGINWMVNCLAK